MSPESFSFLVVSVCLAISAAWELLEWAMVVVFYPESGPEWLGTQGTPGTLTGT